MQQILAARSMSHVGRDVVIADPVGDENIFRQPARLARYIVPVVSIGAAINLDQRFSSTFPNDVMLLVAYAMAWLLYCLLRPALRLSIDMHPNGGAADFLTNFANLIGLTLIQLIGWRISALFSECLANPAMVPTEAVLVVFGLLAALTFFTLNITDHEDTRHRLQYVARLSKRAEINCERARLSDALLARFSVRIRS